MHLKTLPFPDLKKQSGNALFLILIAVALFAALAYAVTQTGRGAGSTSKEQVALAATQILDYTATIQAAVTRLMAAGCTSTQLNFASSRWSVPESYDAIYHLKAPADHSCDIFDPAGAGVAWQAPPAIARGLASAADEYAFTAMLSVWTVGTDCYGCTTGNELTIIADVSKEVCIQLNSQLGNVPTTPPVPQHNFTATGVPMMYVPGGPSGSSGLTFYGDFAAWANTWAIGYNAAQALELRGKWAGCYQNMIAPPYQYTYYSVLVPR